MVTRLSPQCQLWLNDTMVVVMIIPIKNSYSYDDANHSV